LRTLLREFNFVPTDARPERLHSRGVAFAPSGGGRAVVYRRIHSATEGRAKGLHATISR
jgi:cytochrome P450 family 138